MALVQLCGNGFVTTFMEDGRQSGRLAGVPYMSPRGIQGNLTLLRGCTENLCNWSPVDSLVMPSINVGTITNNKFFLP